MRKDRQAQRAQQTISLGEKNNIPGCIEGVDSAFCFEIPREGLLLRGCFLFESPGPKGGGCYFGGRVLTPGNFEVQKKQKWEKGWKKGRTQSSKSFRPPPASHRTRTESFGHMFTIIKIYKKRTSLKVRPLDCPLQRLVATRAKFLAGVLTPRSKSDPWGGA